MKTKCSIGVFVLLTSVFVSDGFAIINGQVETDHAAVGVVSDGVGNMGSAVLIDSYWVLTSAAFVSVCTDGFFYVGLDYATPDTAHAISDVYPHPNYDPDTGAHNIALVRLAAPVAGVTPIPYLTSPSALFPGSTVLFVGYGWTSLHDDSNTIRHSCSNMVSHLEAMTFVTLDSDAGPYLGDAGGPALLDIGGIQHVAGLVSLIAAGELEYTVSVRVSVYDSFIQTVMAANPPPSGVADEIPSLFVLHPCVPNPFNPQTTIRYDLLERAHVNLQIHDIAGRLVRTLLDGEMVEPGRRETVWRGRDAKGCMMPSGTYFYRLEAGGNVQTMRMTLLK